MSKGIYILSILFLSTLCFCIDYNKNILLLNGRLPVEPNALTSSLTSQDLSHLSASSKDIAQFILHFKLESHETHEDLQTKKALVERFLDIKLTEYIPHQSYRVHGTIQKPWMEAQSTFKDFLTVIRVQPEFKLSQSITLTQTHVLDEKIDRATFEITLARVGSLDLKVFERLIKEEKGFSIYGRLSTNREDKIYVSVGRDSIYAFASYLSTFDDVLFISMKFKDELMNINAAKIVINGEEMKEDNYYKAIKSNFSGTNEIVTVTDTGLDHYRCFFHDKKEEPKFYDLTTPIKNSTHRKIHGYLTIMDDLSRHTHGTHVAGTVAGQNNCEFKNSTLSTFNGVVENAKILFTDIGCDQEKCYCPKDVPCDCDEDDGDDGYCTFDQLGVPHDYAKHLFPFAKESGSYIHTNSWGGTPNEYGDTSRNIDLYAQENPDFLILFAAGNSYPQPVARQAQAKNIITVGSSDTNWTTFEFDFFHVRDYNTSAKEVQLSLKERNINCTANPDLCEFINEVNVNSDSCCKHVSKHKDCGVDLKPHPLLKCCQKCAQDYALSLKNITPKTISFFSSVGPTSDGRIKPDFVVPGHELLSARSHFPKVAPNTTDESLHFHLEGMRGTSMATPTAAGFAAFVREYLKVVMKITKPSASAIKATLINSANPLEVNKTYPNDRAGFGRVQLFNSLPMPGVSKKLNFVIFDEITVGNEVNYFVNVDSNARPFQATLVWTDPIASSLANSQLVNDLDLTITSKKGKEFFSNGQVNKTDELNNVEKIRIEDPTIGIYTISIKPKKSADKKQKFSLAISGDIVLIDENDMIKTRRLKLIVLIVAVVVTVATMAVFVLVILIKRKKALNEGYIPIQD